MTTEPKTEPTPEPEPLTDEDTNEDTKPLSKIELVALEQLYFQRGGPLRPYYIYRLFATIAARDAEIEKTRALVAEVRRVCDESARNYEGMGRSADFASDAKVQLIESIAARLRPHLPEGKL